MLTDRWPDIQELLQAALEQPPERRSAWLEQQAADDVELLAEVRSLLVADARAERFLEVDALESFEPESAMLSPGARIGRFEVVRPLGRGGMGYVVLAVRADDAFRQEVAIKVADRAARAADSQRLRQERQILADLDHPNIARLFDGGTTAEGWPYLVMERIEGESLDRWLARRPRPVAQRLRLFRKVLGAVAYAHRHLVVHLDLKPSNVLVTAEGEPKLVDFGIAQLLAPTRQAADDGDSGPRPLTPDYASPEQLRGARLTAASDIYSLGVVLHKLLTGVLPQALRALRLAAQRPGAEVEDAPPVQLPRDLAAILERALQQEPEQRYGSAEAFDEDLARYLSHRPVLARQGDWAYRGGLFLRRHRLASGLAALLFLTAVGAALILSLQARRLAGERDRAEVARAEAEDIGSFLGDLFRGFEPGETARATVSVPQVLDRGVAALAELDQEPAVRAQLLLTLGRAYRNWGHYQQAQTALDEALALRTRHLGPEHPEVAATVNELGRLALDRGAYADAADRHRQALAIYRSHFGEDDLRVAETLTLLGDALIESSQLASAATLLRQGCDIRRRVQGEAHVDTARCGTLLAKVEIDLGQPAAALELAQDSVRVLEARLGPEHLDLAEALNMLAYAQMHLGRLQEAERSVRRVLALRRQIYPEGHVSIAETLNNLAILLSKVGQDREAEGLSREALAIVTAAFGADSDRAANVLHNLAVALRNQGRSGEAEAALRSSIDILRRVLPERHHRNQPLELLAELLLEQGRVAEATRLANEAYALTRTALGEEHPRVVALERLVARCQTPPGQASD